MLLLVLLAGCCDRCGVGPRAMVGGATLPATYEALIRSSKVVRPRGGDEGRLAIDTFGSLYRSSPGGPPAQRLAWLRIDEVLDANGEPLPDRPDAAGDGGFESINWDSDFHLTDRGYVLLQGGGRHSVAPAEVEGAARIRGTGVAVEAAELVCRTIELGGRTLPTEYISIAPGVDVSITECRQEGQRLWFVARVVLANAPGIEPESRWLPDPSISPSDLVVGAEHGPWGYDEERPPALLGYELLDEHGCVLRRVSDWGHGQSRRAGFFGEVETEVDLDVARPVAAVNVIAVTALRTVEAPFEAELIGLDGRSK